MNRRGHGRRLMGMRRLGPTALPVLLLAALLAAGCGEVVVAGGPGRADLRLVADPAVTRFADGDQVVWGWIENAGELTATDVRVTVMTFVDDLHGVPVRYADFDLPVANEVDGLTTLFPGERGFFETPILGGAPPIAFVDVEIRARFHGSGFIFFFFSPGLVIITG